MDVSIIDVVIIVVCSNFSIVTNIIVVGIVASIIVVLCVVD